MSVLSTSALAQAAALTAAVLLGQVSDRTTGQPLPGVIVQVGTLHTTSDKAGRFTLKGVRAGAQTLTASSSDVPVQHFHATVAEPSTRFNVRVCSTTLDYDCSGTTGGSGSAG
jgi:protocatechuate 3,4-dioxygenase beta subunit